MARFFDFLRAKAADPARDEPDGHSDIRTAADALRTMKSRIALDDHGQPVNRFLNQHRRLDRGVNELIGFARGVLADGRVDRSEAIALAKWIVANEEVATTWPVSVLSERVMKVFEDGRIDPSELVDLKEALQELTSCESCEQYLENAATALPLDSPEPPVFFPEHSFLFTGKFLYGTRNSCIKATEERGGICIASVRKDLNYLVIGTLGSADWAHSAFGRKIETGVDYRDRFGRLRIVSERNWTIHLKEEQPGR